MWNYYRNQGRWLMARDYNEVQGMPIPIDGTPTMVMLESEPLLYILSMDNGRKMIQGYKIEAIGNTNTVDDRLAKLEEFAKKMSVLFDDEGSSNNESNSTTAK